MTTVVGSVLHDARHGLRSRRATLWLTFTLLSLALTATTVTYSVVDAIAIEPLPFSQPDRLVAISVSSPYPNTYLPLTAEEYFAIVDGAGAFDAIGAARVRPNLRLSRELGGGDLVVRFATPTLFDSLGVRAIFGRTFDPDDAKAGGRQVVLLSYRVWISTFDGDTSVIGRPVSFEDGDRTVIGVLPPHVSFPLMASGDVDVYIPDIDTPTARASRARALYAVGRLSPGVEISRAQADVSRVTAEAVLTPLRDQVVGGTAKWLLLSFAAVCAVLAVACANVAILLLSRSLSRTDEFGTRLALGASRLTLAGSALAEGVLLAGGALCVSVVASHWLVGIVTANLPVAMPRTSAIAIDGRVLAAALGLALLASVMVSIAPAVLAGRIDVNTMRRPGGGGFRATDRILSGFLVFDIAAVSALLLGTAVVVTSFVLVTRVDLGFRRQHLWSLTYQQSLADVPSRARPAAVATLRDDLLRLVASIPGVADAALIRSGTPLTGTRGGARLVMPGIGAVSGSDVDSLAVSANYFRFMGMRITSGRGFQLADSTGSEPVIIVNEAFVRRFLSRREPVGTILSYQYPPPGPSMVVGVVNDVRTDGPEEDARPQAYTLLDQMPYHDFDYSVLGGPGSIGVLLVRTVGDDSRVQQQVEDAVRSRVTRVPHAGRIVEADFRRLTAVRRFSAGVMVGFGVIGALIGAVGVYGCVAFFVRQRWHTLGIQVALGASPRAVMRQVLLGAMGRVALGVGLGLIGAACLRDTLAHFTFGISPLDIRLYLATAGVLLFVGAAAAFVPARRALKLNPLEVLRRADG